MANMVHMEYADIDESVFTTSFTVEANCNRIYRQGKLVYGELRLTNVTAAYDDTNLAIVPQGFRPSLNTYIWISVRGNAEHNVKTAFLYTGGEIKSGININNDSVRIFATWLTD